MGATAVCGSDFDGGEEAGDIWQDGERERGQRDAAEAAAVAIAAVWIVERVDVELAPPIDEIIRDHDPADRA